MRAVSVMITSLAGERPEDGLAAVGVLALASSAARYDGALEQPVVKSRSIVCASGLLSLAW